MTRISIIEKRQVERLVTLPANYIGACMHSAAFMSIEAYFLLYLYLKSIASRLKKKLTDSEIRGFLPDSFPSSESRSLRILHPARQFVW